MATLSVPDHKEVAKGTLRSLICSSGLTIDAFIDLASGIIRTAAGNGISAIPESGALASESPLLDPRGVAEDSQGNLSILSRRGHALRVVRSDGRIYTAAGSGEPHAADGPALQAGLNGPKRLCIDLENRVIIADAENHLIKRYDPKATPLLTIPRPMDLKERR